MIHRSGHVCWIDRFSCKVRDANQWRQETKTLAVLYPQISQIEEFVPHPEAGELALIRFLADHLDDTFHVFFQPMMDGDKPDVVILNQDCGVVSWEVKDCNLEHYNFTSDGQCQLRSDGTPLYSPAEQVVRYKKRLLKGLDQRRHRQRTELEGKGGLLQPE